MSRDEQNNPRLLDKTIPRRAVLSGGAAGLALASLPGCGDKDGDTGTALKEAGIDHVVVLMMENRSFDHYLGALSLEEGRDDVDGLTGTEVNLDGEGNPYSPEHLTEDCQVDPPHGWSSSHTQFNDGANDGFVSTHDGSDVVESGETGWSMGYYTRDDLPVHYTLADHFCVPDRFFCSVMSSTWPNRLYAHTASSKGVTSNDLPLEGYDQRSIYQALREVGEEWRYFYTDIPFFGLLKDHWDEERVGLIEDFFKTAEDGELPAFTWVDPGFSYNDDHPPHHIKLGQLFIALVYEALVSSPQWERTLLVISYDEHGGFYDHVPPPKVQDDYADLGFDQLGFRIPALLVGPWVKQTTDSTVYDHASVLKYVCDRFGIEPWNTRIATANSIESCLDTERMEAYEPISPPTIPAFDAPTVETLPSECNYGDVHGQTELADWVARNMPHTDRRDRLDDLHRSLMSRARQRGLLKSRDLS
ncbi:MAG: phospholipase C [Myxococcota bacterium]|jgi:phospholipase C